MELSKATFNYTNHTVMAEALEKWAVSMMSKLLPSAKRHVEVTGMMNHISLQEVLAKRGDGPHVCDMSIRQQRVRW